MVSTIAVVGSGVAGVAAVQALRSEGYDGRLFLIGKEREHPYDRTALSKTVLCGEKSHPPLLLPTDSIADLRVEMVLDTTAVRLDVERCELEFDNGSSLKADRVLLATGARARAAAIPGVTLAGVATLRTATDAYELRQQWHPGQHLIVVGGGLIGCEVATTARKLGLDVTILEASDELLQRVLGRRIGRWCRQRLEELGVTVRLNAGVAEFTGTDRLTGVIDTAGEVLSADSAILCVGAEPETMLAEESGLRCSRGIVVNASGGTGAESVFAAGDAASWPLRTGGRRSLETYINSQKEAAAVASAMLGSPVPAAQVPLSWTEIAGRHIQMVGDIEGAGTFVARGNLEDGAAVLFRVDNGSVMAAVSVDAPRDFAMAARLVDAGLHVNQDALSDSDMELRKIYQAARREAALT
ncbi:pyridine nucleotide-disulfide oxidoreductase [Rhodococcus oxybenzonivorans]|uniref:Pyridine nucleotide-disulfide oxidoreductase n=1 Tax=Rhodococcus oxybenzonivorans TaxID=1990687 RepID=A0A2S2BVF0_9NOCA|nr:FAD-dependent oxidoreductase [Rhodococcus oxybenzonivorans]AWK72539.1 pyridine nucleotide-disulfide oxidoreductase [Rhodococcus oxybenzonivorans]